MITSFWGWDGGIGCHVSFFAKKKEVSFLLPAKTMCVTSLTLESQESADKKQNIQDKILHVFH